MRPTDVIETSRIEFLNLPPVWVVVLVIVPVLLLACRWLYRKEPLEGRLAWLPPALRFLLLATIVTLLFHPVRTRQRVRVERPVAAILLDDSASMRERDVRQQAEELDLPEESTRSEVVRAALAAPLGRLGQRYETLLFGFGDDLRAVGGLSDLAAADGSTRLGDALAALAAETRGRELAQVVLVSDGRSNAGREVGAALAALATRGVPVSTVGVGDPEVPRDLRLGNVVAPEVALAGDTVTLEVAVAARGYPNAPAVVKVLEEGGAELGRTDLVLPPEEGLTEQLVRVGFTPDRDGDLELRVVVEPQPGERDTANNVERRVVRVEPGKIKVLYVDGYPRYEYRFLKNLLLRVSNVDAQCLLLSADPEFIQESSEGTPPLTRFPPTLTDLLAYHVVIFGDVPLESPYLGPEPGKNLENVKAFVEAGGGFLMQAGSLHAPRQYANTPIADILPVLLGDPATEWAAVHEPGLPFRPQLERPRDPHEIVTLDPDVETNRLLWEGEGGLAPLTWYWPVAKARTTADVLLTHPLSRNAHGPHVLLATMYVPQGRTAFLGTDETWRWRMLYLETYREAFWRGLIRFLALNRLRRTDYRFDLATDRSSYDIGERIDVTARLQDSNLQPLEAAEVELVVVPPDGRRATALLLREEPGVFRGAVPATDTGSWRLWLEDPLDAGGEPKSPRVVNVTTPSAELDDPALDEALLRQVAAQTGGRYVRLQDASRLLDGLDDVPAERALDEPDREEVWASYPSLLVLLALAAAEWIVRKRSNLV